MQQPVAGETEGTGSPKISCDLPPIIEEVVGPGGEVFPPTTTTTNGAPSSPRKHSPRSSSSVLRSALSGNRGSRGSPSKRKRSTSFLLPPPDPVLSSEVIKDPSEKSGLLLAESLAGVPITNYLTIEPPHKELNTQILDRLVHHRVLLGVVLLSFLILLLLGFFVWHDFTWRAWFIIILIFITFTFLIKGIEPACVMLGNTTLLLVAGVITSAQALSGFSNADVFTIGVLFVIAAAVVETGSVNFLADFLLGNAKTVMAAQIRLMLPLAILSAFTNNTPLCAMMIPGHISIIIAACSPLQYT